MASNVYVFVVFCCACSKVWLHGIYIIYLL